ncbi:MAG: hypothetical protein QOJ76_3071 [Acidobacteriota bacterium]|jgi:heme/copper-type cytochrome/quinol oxidase subunit 2|nr:hypothetical protein [Acidobacteriota bacterium]
MNSPADFGPLDEETAAAAREAGGHPVRAAILISIVVFVAVAALVYAVFRFSIQPETETTRPPAHASSR